jgi:Domain of unknown function (DUF4123)
MPRNGFILFDAARAEYNLNKALELGSAHRSFYKGRSEEELAAVAPYLFETGTDSSLVTWYIGEGWGKSWGTLLLSDSGFDEVYAHFRTFLFVRTEAGKELYFRFYDPRVLKIFLNSCDRQQILEFFGSVLSFFVESENKDEVFQLWQENGVLRQKTTDIRHLSETFCSNTL